MKRIRYPEPVTFGCSCHPDAYPFVLYNGCDARCFGCGTRYELVQGRLRATDGLMYDRPATTGCGPVNVDWPA